MIVGIEIMIQLPVIGHIVAVGVPVGGVGVIGVYLVPVGERIAVGVGGKGIRSVYFDLLPV